MKHVISLLSATLVLNGCVATSDVNTKLDNISQNQTQIQNTCSNDKEEILTEIRNLKNTNENNAQQLAELRKIKDQNKAMSEQLSKLENLCKNSNSNNDNDKSSNKAQTKEVVFDNDKNSNKVYDGKSILGTKEWTLLENYDVAIETRVDTGATTSSINALNIQQFERDGKKWIKFDLPDNNGNLIPLEAKFSRSTEIVQSSESSQKQTRIVAKLKIKIGNVSKVAEFTLVDRSHMSYSLLLGREFMKDEVLVDVAKEYNQGKPKAQTYIKKKTFFNKNGELREE